MTKVGFKHTQATREKMSIARKKRVGSLSPRWKGGIRKGNGRLYIHCPSHPNNKKNYVLRSRIVVEKSIGRLLTSSEIIHHKNGNKLDDRIENLEIHSRASHNTLHKSGENHHNRKLKKEAVNIIRLLYKTKGYFQRELAQLFGVSQSQIGKIVSYKQWRKN